MVELIFAADHIGYSGLQRGSAFRRKRYGESPWCPYCRDLQTRDQNWLCRKILQTARGKGVSQPDISFVARLDSHGCAVLCPPVLCCAVLWAGVLNRVWAPHSPFSLLQCLQCLPRGMEASQGCALCCIFFLHTFRGISILTDTSCVANAGHARFMPQGKGSECWLRRGTSASVLHKLYILHSDSTQF
jgi:hypothetical protein